MSQIDVNLWAEYSVYSYELCSWDLTFLLILNDVTAIGLDGITLLSWPTVEYRTSLI